MLHDEVLEITAQKVEVNIMFYFGAWEVFSDEADGESFLTPQA